MDVVVLIVTHLIGVGIGFAFGRVKGYNEAQPKRDAKGRFTTGA